MLLLASRAGCVRCSLQQMRTSVSTELCPRPVRSPRMHQIHHTKCHICIQSFAGALDAFPARPVRSQWPIQHASQGCRQTCVHGQMACRHSEELDRSHTSYTLGKIASNNGQPPKARCCRSRSSCDFWARLIKRPASHGPRPWPACVQARQTAQPYRCCQSRN